MKKILITLMAALPILGMAQIDMPKPSPLSTVTQTVGLTDASITYSRPSAKGRTVFGDLVPYGEMWRTGANASTKIKFSDDVKIEGQDVPAGEYALYTIPGKDVWTIIIHKNTSYWGTGDDKYKIAEDQARFTVKPMTYPVKIETLTFGFTDLKNDEAYIELLWENTQVRFKVVSEVDKKVMADINNKMKGVTASTYYQSAQYYYENDKDLTQALVWVNKAIESGEKFWIVKLKSMILAKQGNYAEDIKAAERSKALALEAKNNDYVRMNDKNIEEWTKLVPAAKPVKGKK